MTIDFGMELKQNIRLTRAVPGGIWTTSFRSGAAEEGVQMGPLAAVHPKFRRRAPRISAERHAKWDLPCT